MIQMFKIQTIITFFLCFSFVFSYAAKMTINTTASSLVTTYQTDLASCQCDITSNCDNFCCCDSDCSSSVTTSWTNSGWCRVSAAELEKMCSELQGSGYESFQDLACVYYTNRGEIGIYYNLPAQEDTTETTPEKFAYQIQNSQAISESLSTAYAYESVVNILKDSTQATFNIWRPTLGTECGIGFVKVSQSQQISCHYPFQTTDDCTTANSYLTATALEVCAFANCSSSVSLSLNVPDGASCNNVITSLSISLTYGYSSGQYKITAASLTYATQTITVPETKEIKTTITVTTGAERSGNPGYINGKQIQFISGSINQISDSSRNCLTANSQNTSLSIPFGVNTTYSCISSSPCSAGYEVDFISKGNFQLSKFAFGEEESISVASEDTCNKEKIILNILYSQAGSSLYYQNYIVSAKITSQSGDIGWTTKYFMINWIYIDPETVSSPPSNYFYEYFSYLWFPLKSNVQNFLHEFTLFFSVMLIFSYAFI